MKLKSTKDLTELRLPEELRGAIGCAGSHMSSFPAITAAGEADSVFYPPVPLQCQCVHAGKYSVQVIAPVQLWESVRLMMQHQVTRISSF